MNRKMTIPPETVGPARTVAEAIRRAVTSSTASSAVDGICRRLGFSRYSPSSPWAQGIAASAVATRFAGTAEDAAEALKTLAEAAEAEGELEFLLQRSSALGSISAAVSAAVSARFPLADRRELAVHAERALTDAALEAVTRLDASSPLDTVAGVDVVVCCIPGLGETGAMDETMTSFWGDESSCLTAKPDACFMRFLTLANVSVPEWIAAVREKHGVDLAEKQQGAAHRWLRERAKGWAEAVADFDPSRPPTADPARLVDAVDACYLGFTPLVSFSVDAREACAADWSQEIEIEGGMLGLHDFVTGTGDPVRFEGTIRLQARVSDMAVGEGVQNDFFQVHGFPRGAFRSRVGPATAPAARSPG